MTPATRALKLRPTVRILALLFVLTGTAGLLAEQCFEKLITSLLGASTPAAAVVLSVYFLGLTLGAWIFGRRFAGRVHPLRAYALLEGGVAAWALMLFLLEPWLVKGLAPLLRLGVGHFVLLQGLRFLVACIWILPPTLCMGASFPAIVDVLERLRVPRPRKGMAGFYALNLLGAVVGAVVGPYIAFPEWGLGGTLLFTAFIDGMAGATGWVLAARLPVLDTASGAATESSTALVLTAKNRFLLALGFISGFLFFGLEVLWTHLVGAVSGNSVYAFASMLALVLIGLGIGGWISARVAPNDRPLSVWIVGGLLLAGSLSLHIQFRTWPGIPSSYILWGQGLRRFEDGEVLRWIQSARLLLPPAVILGMVYPALFRLEAFPGHARARMASLLGAWNSLGCVLGALLTGFWLLPTLGSERTLFLFGEILLLFGLVLVAWFARKAARGMLLAGGATLAILWGTDEAWDRLQLTNGGHVYFHPAHVDSTSRLLFFHEDTLGGITTVVERPVPGGRPPMKTLLTNGKFQANDAGEVQAQSAFALLPILNTRRFEDALVIGLGSGHSAEVVGTFGFPRIDIAEISPGIVQAARRHFSHINGNILDRPGVTLRLEDGRNHLLLTDRRYDLITMEISSVWFAGSTSLYCEEFYEVAKARLKPGGIFQQWIQVHHLSAIEIGSVLSTLRRVFPHVSFWWVGGQGILVASDQPLEIQPEAVRRFYQINPWSDPNEPAQNERLRGLLASRVLSDEDFNRLLMVLEFPINTDRNRFLEYATPKYNLSAEPFEARNLAFLAKFSAFRAPSMAPGMPPGVLALGTTLTPDVIRQFLGITDAARPSTPVPDGPDNPKVQGKKTLAGPPGQSHP